MKDEVAIHLREQHRVFQVCLVNLFEGVGMGGACNLLEGMNSNHFMSCVVQRVRWAANDIRAPGLETIGGNERKHCLQDIVLDPRCILCN